MSRAFVKEQDADAPDVDAIERVQSDQPNYTTREGFEQLRARYEALLAERSQLTSDAMENPSARQRKRQLDSDIAYMQERLERTVIVESGLGEADVVRFGAVVQVRGEDGLVREFHIVGENEADIKSGKVNWESPLAQALLGASVGEVVTWERPAGPLELEIVSVHYPTIA